MAEDVTAGCSTPDGYCPAVAVKRGQMAAFLVRALDLPPGAPDRFVDDDASPFEADIDALAEAGITGGCNPPDNDRFCPGDPVTRAQMATFLVRALDLPAGTSDRFVDDDESPFEADIDALAEPGITGGCNPPDNDRFCPGVPVTRAQMATFLGRALELEPKAPPPRSGTPTRNPTDEIGVSDLPNLALATAFPAPDQLGRMDTATSLADIAAGPNNILVSRNDYLSILDKSGRLVARHFFGGWWGIHLPEARREGLGVAYPRVIYDASSQRFFIIGVGRQFTDPPCEAGECAGDLFIAVSRSDTPTSFDADDWYFHHSQGALDNDEYTRNTAGYPSMHVTEDVFVFAMSMSEYPRTVGGPAYGAGGKLRMFDKAALLAGRDADWADIYEIPHPRPSPEHGQEFVDRFTAPHRLDQTGPHLVVSGSGLTCDVEVWEIIDPLDQPRLERRRAESEFQCRGSPTEGREVPMPDGSTQWGEHHVRLFPHPVHTGGSIWGARTVSLRSDDGGWDGNDESWVHWFEIDVSDWPNVAMRQEGLLGAPGSWYDYPALSVDSAGNVAMVFRRTGPHEWPSAYITGRQATDPPGTMRPSTLLAAGSTTPEKPRWGYYYGAATDPTDERIWLHGQYGGGPELTTYIAAVQPGTR